MTPESPGFSQSLGFLEGRIAEHSMLLQDLREGQRQINACIDSVTARIDRMFFATWAVGGGIMAALLGLLATLILRS